MIVTHQQSVRWTISVRTNDIDDGLSMLQVILTMDHQCESKQDWRWKNIDDYQYSKEYWRWTISVEANNIAVKHVHWHHQAAWLCLVQGDTLALTMFLSRWPMSTLCCCERNKWIAVWLLRVNLKAEGVHSRSNIDLSKVNPRLVTSDTIASVALDCH